MNGREKTLYEGTYQFERFPEGLKDDFVKIDERTFVDFIKESAEFAKKVHYYDENNQKAGDWCAFFEDIYDYEKSQVKISSLEEFEKNASVSPHLGLFLSFLKLFEIFQQDLNALSRKHIDFYYKDILGFKTVPPLPDKVALFFEANKNVEDGVLVPSGTEFSAGMDNSGKPLIYKTDSDLLVNHAKVSKLTKCPQSSTARYIVVSSKTMNIADRTEKMIELRDFAMQFQKVLKVEYSTAEGWKEAEVKFNGATSGGPLFSTWEIPEGMEPFAPYSEKIHKMNLPIADPALRIQVAGVSSNFDYSRLSLTIEVKKTKDFKIKAGDKIFTGNDTDFYPLGLHPKKGDSFFVSEIFGNAVPDTEDTYELYKLGVGQKVMMNCNWELSDCDFSKLYRPYVNPKLAEDLKGIDMKHLPVVHNVTDNYLNSVDPLVLFDWYGIKKYILDFDLGYNVYSSVIQAVTNYNIRHSDDLQAFPHAPFIPQLKSLSLDVDLWLSTKYPQSMQIFQVYGPESQQVDETTDIERMFSSANALYVDIEMISRPSMVSLYFDTKESGEGKDKQIGNEDYPEWFFKGQSSWMKFTTDSIVKDTTNKLTRNGIVNLKLSQGAIDDGKACIKIAYPTDAYLAFPEIENVYTQVVNAVCVSSLEDSSHYEDGIPAGKITRSKIPIIGLKSVQQLFPSFGGRGKEKDEQFYTRVSERLRHKGRAWNIWDYERLILEKFPFVYKVKCVPCSDENHLNGAPGSVMIILFPDCAQVKQSNDLKPCLSVGQIESVRKYIDEISSPFAEIKVMNAGYDEVHVSCKVSYQDGCNDVSYYNARLNDELVEYLAPWTSRSKEIDFHKVLYKSQILYFIETRPYVDFIEELYVDLYPSENQFSDGDESISIDYDQKLCPTVATRLLTSVPKHNIYTKENE